MKFATKINIRRQLISGRLVWIRKNSICSGSGGQRQAAAISKINEKILAGIKSEQIATHAPNKETPSAIKASAPLPPFRVMTYLPLPFRLLSFLRSYRVVKRSCFLKEFLINCGKMQQLEHKILPTQFHPLRSTKRR